MKQGLSLSEIDKALTKIKSHPVIALVDDEVATLDLLERILKLEGYVIHCFQTGEEFLARFSEICPDVVVMEDILPGISALSILEGLRPKTVENIVPTIIISRKDDVHAKLLAFRRGAYDYILKPFEGEEVAARIRAAVRNKILLEMIQKSSVSDPLTSLYNFRFLSIWLAKEIERVKRYHIELSCLLIDLDQFGKINATNGEPYGDFLLHEFANYLNQNTRRSDIVGRLRDDEFLILLPGTPKDKAMAVAKRLRTKVSQHPFEWKKKTTIPSFSIGITGFETSETIDAASFLDRAEEALKKARSIGVGETAVLGSD